VLSWLWIFHSNPSSILTFLGLFGKTTAPKSMVKIGNLPPAVEFETDSCDYSNRHHCAQQWTDHCPSISCLRIWCCSCEIQQIFFKTSNNKADISFWFNKILKFIVCLYVTIVLQAWKYTEIIFARKEDLSEDELLTFSAFFCSIQKIRISGWTKRRCTCTIQDFWLTSAFANTGLHLLREEYNEIFNGFSHVKNI